MVSEYIKKIRAADEKTKKRWVIIASGFAMILIIFLWVIYISATLPRTSVEINTQQLVEVKKIENNNGNSIVSSISEGIKITTKNIFASLYSVGTTFKEGLKKAFQYATKKNEIIIKNEEKTTNEIPFQPNDPEPIESIQLK